MEIYWDQSKKSISKMSIVYIPFVIHSTRIDFNTMENNTIFFRRLMFQFVINYDNYHVNTTNYSN